MNLATQALWLVMTGCATFHAPLYAAEPPCKMSLTGFDNTSILNTYAEAVLSEAYHRADCSYVIHKFPPKRGDMEANSGLYDGLVGRSSAGEASSPNLLRVPTPIGHFDLVPYVRDKTLAPKLTSWDSIRQSGLEVGVRFGSRASEYLDATVAGSPGTYDALVHMLLYNRLDVIVMPAPVFNDMMQSAPEPTRARMAALIALPSLHTETLYHYLHKAHAALLPSIDTALKRMTQEGRIQHVWQQGL